MEQSPVQVVEEPRSASDVPILGSAGEPLLDASAKDQRKWERRSDDQIKLAVMTALHWDLAVPRDRVRVSVDRGWVTLSGHVAREYERSSAEADARTTRGVTGVTNAIACGSAER